MPLGTVARAPAAIEDARAALHWLVLNASDFGVDTTRIISAGESAGGHLALMVALLPNRHIFDNSARHSISIAPHVEAARVKAGSRAEWFGELPPIAAVVNYFGVSDVAALTEGKEAMGFALAWLGSHADDSELLRLISPLHYIHAGSPPVFSIHGKRDVIVPFDQSVNLHRALTNAGVKNFLLEVPEGGHGNFDQRELVRYRRQSIAFVSQVISENAILSEQSR